MEVPMESSVTITFQGFPPQQPALATVDLNEIVNKLPQGFTDYVHQHVAVTTSITQPGATVNKNETFTIFISAKNNGNASLKNVKYRVSVGSSSIAQLLTPPGSNTNLVGDLLDPGKYVKGFIHDPGWEESKLEPGESQQWTVYGKAIAGGTTNIQAGITADLDLDLTKRNSWLHTQQLAVVD